MKEKIRFTVIIFAVISCLFSGCGRILKEKGQEEILLPVEAGNVEAETAKPEAMESEIPREAGTENAQVRTLSHEADEESTEPADAKAAYKETEDGKAELKQCVVHICGAVESPGVYTLEDGSRVYQAIEMAGGMTKEADSDYLNQADFLTDGMKIYVPTQAELAEMGGLQAWQETGPAAGAAAGTAKESETSSLININTAGEELLCRLPGIGSSKAKSIISYREKNGSFQKIEDIMNVEGIKDGLFQKIKDSITV